MQRLQNGEGDSLPTASRLQKVGVNPDGSAFAYRIIDPRQFILSASFDL